MYNIQKEMVTNRGELKQNWRTAKKTIVFQLTKSRILCMYVVCWFIFGGSWRKRQA